MFELIFFRVYGTGSYRTFAGVAWYDSSAIYIVPFARILVPQVNTILIFTLRAHPWCPILVIICGNTNPCAFLILIVSRDGHSVLRFNRNWVTGENRSNRSEPPTYFPVEVGKTRTGKSGVFQPELPR